MSDQETIAPEQKIEVGPFRPEDAPQAAQCYRVVYGDDYPVKLYYDPKALTAAVANGDIHMVVARTSDGQVVGVSSLFRSAPCEKIYEIGAGLVLPEFRTGGVSSRMLAYLHGEYSTKLGLDLIWGEPVCNHIFQQRISVNLGFTSSALEVNLMPARAYSQDKDVVGRVATLLAFMERHPRPHDVHLPPLHAAQLAEIYAWSTLERRQLPADETPPAEATSQLDVQFFDFAGVLRVTVRRIGADLPRRLAELEADYRGRGLEVTQIWLDLAQPKVGWAARQAKDAGFFLGGLLARWFDSDGMLLQKVQSPVDWDAIQLHGPQNQRLGQLVRADYEC